MKKKINSQKSTSTVLFSLPKSVTASANSVVVVGDFSEWNPIALKAQKDGSFAVEVEIPLGREYHFRYQIDGRHWENDMAADRYVTSPIYGHIQNSVLNLIDVEQAPVAAIKPKAKTTVKKEVVKAASKVVAKTAAKVATLKKTVETTTEASKVVGKVVTKKADTTVKAASKVATSVVDDLTKIEGIGPKIADLLKADGIESFEKLAKSGIETVKTILDKAGKRYQMHNPSTWMAQAKIAAKGDWESLKKWQDELSGGKAK
jgi:predicted flap endonuclease-1-like 5' DNA nuclease